MKVAQNDETIPDTQPVRPPHPPNLSNSQLSPSGSSARKHGTPGILSRMFFPLHRYHLLPRWGTPNTAYCLVIFCDACLLCIHYFFPLFSPVDYETDAAADQFDYGVDDPSLSLARATRQAPPLITRYRLFFSILLH